MNMKMKMKLILTSGLTVLGLAAAPLAWSDEEHEYSQAYTRHLTGSALPDNPVYQNECSGCHMAYPPGLLPEGSWRKLMSGLNDHFDDNAELDATNRKIITDFLAANSADKSAYRRSRRFATTRDGDTVPLRISEMPYFLREHNKIPTRLVTGNKDVLSFSNCNACHRKAEQGSFRERDIRIPGYGQWDDD